jgi:hypothetical protein
MATEPDAPRRQPVPAPIAWASRHGGLILFGLLIAVAMIEAVAMFAAKRAAATEQLPVLPASDGEGRGR